MKCAKILGLTAIGLVLGAACALAQGSGPSPQTPVQKRGEQRDPRLPNVLLLGDSISIGYTAPTIRLLAGTANVTRAPTNCGDTNKGLRDLTAWLGDSKWDVIHFNWGLHDLCYRHPESKVYGKLDKERGTVAVPIGQYRTNLELLVDRLRQTGATLVWANITAVPEGEPGRFAGDAVKYNEVAAEIMRRHAVRINDLYSLSLGLDEALRTAPANVHFTARGYEELATQVAQEIRAALKARRS